MRIVVVEFAGKGGMIHYVFQLCRAMAEAGAEVTLITSKQFELASLPRNFSVEPIIDLWDPKVNDAGPILRKVRRVARAFRYYAQWLRVIRRVAKLKPDVVQVGDITFPLDLLPLRLLRRKAPLFADICHNVNPFDVAGGFGRSRWKRFFYRRIYGLFDVVFVHFDRNAAEFAKSFRSRRTAVIRHGNEALFQELRDPGVTAAVLRKRLRIGDEPVVLFFGTLSHYKGVDVLLRAFPRIRRETGARLVLAGYPLPDFELPAQQEFVTLVPEYIKSEEVAAWMELADVIVFPYRDIYQSGAIHVAQTFGVPTVASAVGAMQDVVEHEVSGLLVPPENAEALAAAVIRLLIDRELASRLGERFASDARGPFSWRANAETILSNYGRGPTFAP
ncbi:MAG TPA: glycosyltransferase family 4 protein [Thermoanaerobaculia bacterium]|nr:glycosyltransferase family 4 protein [Thermoanaerobaculia bacterium]